MIATIHSGFKLFKYNLSNLCKEATPATPEMRRVVKVMTFDVEALCMAFLGTFGTIF